MPSKKSAWPYIDHISPIVILSIDYGLNRIPFNLRHLPISMGMMLCYGIVNMTYVLTTGKVIYKPLNYHDTMSFVWMVVLASLEGLAYFGMYYLTQWKLTKIQSSDIRNNSVLTVYNVENSAPNYVE